MFPFRWSCRDWCRALVAFAVALLLGMAIWWTSPWITGHSEPWDADGRYYAWALFTAGFVATVFLPKAFWLVPIGVCIGQLLYGWYFVEPQGDALRLVGMVLMVVYSVAALAGAVGCVILIWLIRLPLGVLRFVLRQVRQVRRRGPLQSP
jgi:hypothetical protein